jgi:hypothetical protein
MVAEFGGVEGRAAAGPVKASLRDHPGAALVQRDESKNKGAPGGTGFVTPGTWLTL